ncbi:class I SAM-dependent methyltransferase [Micromonospora sp. HUAS LYJ1]|uniref:class I SAM-dependent methyltransferase n=1 Tax=Micromonospora sp. HUAS LYJ1 TaxID=3061626 RepID=UPI0026727BD3|nr:class I SAM-dependent methyltransferase [Micromonospora sp. HUAS LYJ1]WKU02940.1 class I SAM-dependent methyltransferase [Micromonospora sp. HUAS LYJ1]
MLDEDLKQVNRTMWSYGDYARVARLLDPGAVRLVDRLDVHPGQRHLDVATGNGNVALLTAARGALVTGLDLTDEFFDDCRRRAAEAGVELTLLAGDGEDLPFPDGDFDLVTSTYGIQFAPRHGVVAAELARVCRPGGQLGMCNWTPRSWTAHFQEALSSYFPAPPEETGQPMLWGDERYVTGLLGRYFELTTQRRTLWYPYPDAEALIAFFESCFGPFIAARRSISPPSRWAQLRAELVEISEDFLVDDDRGRGFAVEYLEVVGRRTEQS